MHHPQYAGPSKDALTSKEAEKAIKILLDEPLKKVILNDEKGL